MSSINISVAMATYNGEKYIRQQLTSILNQSMMVDEIIVVDDNSNDKTIEIIEEMRCPQIRIYKNSKNLGYVENFYRAISLTHGKYVFLSDQDDIWEQEKVKLTLAELQKSDRNMAVCTGFSLIDQDDNPIVDIEHYQVNDFVLQKHKDVEELTLKRLAFGNVVQGCTYCVRRDAIEVYLKVHNNEVIHDYQLMLISAAMGKVKYLNKSLIRYRLHGNNAVGFEKKKHRLEMPRKKPSKEPYMARFFRQLSEEIIVPHKNYYTLLYYLRIPYLASIIKNVVSGG